MIYLTLFLSTFILSASIIFFVSPIAANIGLVDKPGAHKNHNGFVPVVGGMAIYISLLTTCTLLAALDFASINSIILSSICILFIVGLFDDRYSLSVTFRLAMQTVASLLLVYSNVAINDFGSILSDEFLSTGIYSTPLTVIATVGVINSINMIDGIDGLVGVISIVILSLLLYVSYISNSDLQTLIIFSIIGSLSGFLLFNMRRTGLNNAKVYMGDAGSTILGFLLAYMLISLSQGEHRAISPVVALWLASVPLMDTLGVINRRLLQSKSPFHGDRGHLHHMMMAAGFRVRQTVYFIAMIQLVLGIVGLTAYYFGIHDRISFLAFVILFIGYAYLTNDHIRTVRLLRYVHKALGLTVRGGRYIYVSNLNRDNAIDVVEAILGNRTADHQYDIYIAKSRDYQTKSVFAVIDAKDTDNIKRYISKMKNFLRSIPNNNKIVIRQYIERGSLFEQPQSYGHQKQLNTNNKERRTRNISILYRSTAEINTADRNT
jgi:UDP-GlcNAc:undecaprenyl-phosphate/decaprenyl-phosphate GlcNAc-1-phosphate transferase